MSSLRARLLLVVIAVGFVAIGATAAIAQQVATDDMRQTIAQRVEVRSGVMDDVTTFVALNGSWHDAGEAIDSIAASHDVRVAVYDDRGEMIADSDPGAELPSFPVGVVEPQQFDGALIQAVMLSCEPDITASPGDTGDITVTIDSETFDACMEAALGDAGAMRSGLVYVGTGADDAASVLGPNGPNGRLVVVAVLVLLGAVAVMALALRPVLAPIGALRNGARRLEEGHLDTRVPETGATELVELAQSFNSMAAALQEDKERQQRWTSDTAHELRNPVQNLRGHLEAAKDGLMAADDEWLDSMLDEAGQLSHLVADLGVLTLSDSGQIALHRGEVDLGEVVDDVVASHRPRAARDGVGLRASGSAVVEGDVRRLRQVISNLVDNALRHTPAGGSVSVEVVSTVGEDGIAAAEVRVADTGEGIPADAQDRIFDRFARVDEHRSRNAGGSGLGLSIVAALVDAHGGEVSVASEEGKGSTFTLTLPAAAPTPGVEPETDLEAGVEASVQPEPDLETSVEPEPEAVPKS